jgi:hypothetical protein
MAYIDDVNAPQFPSDLACEAAQIDLATLKNWASRKPSAVLIGDEERVASGEQRSVFRFTLRRVLQLAITAELVKLGLAPREASLHAAQFTDMEDGELPGRQSRRMGELFRRHHTFMLIYPDAAYCAIENIKADEPWRLVVRKGDGAPRNFSSAIILNLNQIDARVRVVVGLPIMAREGT